MINVRESAELSAKKNAAFVPALNRVAGASGELVQSVEQLGASGVSALGLVETELAAIAPAVAACQAALREGQQTVLQRLQGAEDRLRSVRGLMQNSQSQLAQATASVTRDAQSLLAVFPAAQSKLHAALEAYKAQMRTDQNAQTAAAETLRATLDKLGTRVARLTEQAGECTQAADRQISQACSAAETIVPELSKSRAEVDGQIRAAGQSYAATLAEVQASMVQPRTQRLAEEVRTDLSEQVARPARASVEQLAQQAEELAQQMQQQEQENTPSRQSLDRTFKEMQSGPQLRPLVKASKSVLQKVGKLSSLGPLAQSL